MLPPRWDTDLSVHSEQPLLSTLPHKQYFVAGVSFPELGSCDIFRGGVGWKGFCLSPGVFWSQVRGIRWLGGDNFFCIGCCLPLPWRRFWWDRSSHPAATLEGGKNNQWSVTSSVSLFFFFFALLFPSPLANSHLLWCPTVLGILLSCTLW